MTFSERRKARSEQRRREAERTRVAETLEKLLKADSSLRQFVYLDAVALRSLMASRYGPEETRTVENISSSNESSVEGTISSGIPTLYSAGITGKHAASSSKGSEVERQATLQSLFRYFLAGERSRLAWDAGSDAARALPNSSGLRRGDLIEVPVDLDADPLLKISTFFNDFYDLAEEGISPSSSSSGTTEMAGIAKLLGRLARGTIPIKAPIPGFAARDGKIVFRSDADVPLNLVAQTEESSFWVNPTRVLFGKRRFTVLARVVEPEIRPSWSAARLFDSMEQVAEPLKKALDPLLSQIEQQEFPAPAVQPLIADLLISFGTKIGLEDDPFLADSARSIGGQKHHRPDSVDAAAAMELLVAAAAQRGFDIDGDSSAAAQLATFKEFAPAPLQVSNLSGFVNPVPQAHHLEVEILAIYW